MESISSAEGIFNSCAGRTKRIAQDYRMRPSIFPLNELIRNREPSAKKQKSKMD